MSPRSAQQASSLRVIVQPPRFDRPEIEIRASARRTKTGNAHWSGSRIIVQVPARMSVRDRDVFVDELVERLLQQRPESVGTDASLEQRARVLADLYNDGFAPVSVRWVTNQRSRWASCSPGTRDIRVSARLRQCPDWVIDAVLVHELAHLQEIEHSPAFYAIANRYPRQHESTVFLEGYALGLGLRIESGDVES